MAVLTEAALASVAASISHASRVIFSPASYISNRSRSPRRSSVSRCATFCQVSAVAPIRSDFEGIVEAIGSSDKRVAGLTADHYGNPIGGGARDGAVALLDPWLRELD
ncbi:hypothetical protein [Nonomuraea basaltis]|uniref:hypothetical protein n=1 Tax=Nonomuraea basaltis TaxID=2495887 RepID=UPI00148736B9|nr:hypothetical protein [Nonomuraea basaltis]